MPWELLAVLSGQGYLSARLLHVNTAMADEPLYLYVGHQEWNHWIHGWPVANYAAYFSGAPTVYPPLGAVADTLGGLTGARILSMTFMLLATVMLWRTADMLYGRVAALCGCVLFVCIGSTQYLGILATYDAMALSLMTVSVYCAVRAAKAPESSRWWIAGTVFLTVANAAKYASALWDPAVIAVAALALYRFNGGDLKGAIRRIGANLAVMVALIALALTAGGAIYYVGIATTTTARPSEGAPMRLIVDDTVAWIGVVLCLALLSVIVAALIGERRDVWLNLVLLAATSAAPANQARIHALTSLQKHADFGAWFGCIAAGYGIVKVGALSGGRWRRALAASVMTAGIVAVSAPAGYAQSVGYARDWPSSTTLIPTVRPLASAGSQHYLVENYEVVAYYLGSKVDWEQWNSTWWIAYRDPATALVLGGNQAYVTAVHEHYFSLIVLNFRATPTTDHAITTAITACPDDCGYRLVAKPSFDNEPGYYNVWQYRGAGS